MFRLKIITGQVNEVGGNTTIGSININREVDIF